MLGTSLSNVEIASYKQQFLFTWKQDVITYLGIELPAEPIGLFAQNFTFLVKQIYKGIQSWHRIPLSWFRRATIFKMNVLPRLLYENGSCLNNFSLPCVSCSGPLMTLRWNPDFALGMINFFLKPTLTSISQLAHHFFHKSNFLDRSVLLTHYEEAPIPLWLIIKYSIFYCQPRNWNVEDICLHLRLFAPDVLLKDF